MKNIIAKSRSKRPKSRAAPTDTIIQLLQQRQTVYGFLKRIYEKELPGEFLREMPRKMKPLLALADVLSSATSQNAVRQLITFTSSISWQNLDTVQLQLAADYARLFLSINKTPPHPSESVYREGPMMQSSRDEVLQTYWSFGVDKKKEFTEPEDHIAVEFGFMMFLCEQAIASLRKGNAREASNYLQAQKGFLEKHLLKWVPKLVNDIIASGRTPFYTGIAVLTDEFLNLDVVAVSELAKGLKG